MAKKFYAVKKGRKTGIFTSWNECLKYVYHYDGASYKGFMTRAEAEAFLEGDKTADTANYKPREDAVVAYVDGSYNISNGKFSYGAVIFKDGETIEMNHAYDDAELAQMRNVAGEIVGAATVMRYCVENGIDKLDLYHDYEGIAKWCTGEWKTAKPATKRYKDFYDSIKAKLDVKFVKVKGHSNDEYNDRADRLAKDALGIK